MSKRRNRFLVSLATLAILLQISPSLNPQSEQPAYADDVFSLAVAKDGKADSSRTSLSFGALTVGAKRTENVLLTNRGDRNLVFLVYSRLSYLSVDGQAQIISGTDSQPYGMATWARFGTQKATAITVSVAIGRSVVVPVEITVAKDAYPGSHTAAIVAQTTLGGGTVTVGKRVALYMSASIGGALKPAVNPTWISDTVFYEMNIRQFSSARTFTGATARIKELKTLGVEALILNPIFPIGKSRMSGTLGSVFAASDLSKVNPSLGTLTSFKSFVTTAKASGMKVLLTVPLETAAVDHDWTVSQSNWFKRNASYVLDPVPSKAYLAYYDYERVELRQEMIEELKSWVVDTDVDGFIFSGATSVPINFLNELAYRLQQTKSLALGTTDAIKSPYFTNSLTLTSNSDLLTSLEKIKSGTSTKSTLGALMTSEVSKFKAPTLPLNHLSSYETMEGGKTETSRFAASLGAASVLSFTLPGAPVIFQGQEVGSIKALKPFDSDFIVWPTKNPAVFADYQKLINLKQSNSALFNEKNGGDAVSLTTTSNSLFAFSRTRSTNRVFVVINLSNKSLKAKFDSGVTATLYKFSDNKSVKMISKGYELTLPAFGYEIFTSAIVK
jgi:hypothetical protein